MFYQQFKKYTYTFLFVYKEEGNTLKIKSNKHVLPNKLEHAFWLYVIVRMFIDPCFARAIVAMNVYKWLVAIYISNRSSHLGIHKQMNACWSISKSQTVFFHFKICIRYAESGNYEAFVVVQCCQFQLIQLLH